MRHLILPTSTVKICMNAIEKEEKENVSKGILFNLDEGKKNNSTCLLSQIKDTV